MADHLKIGEDWHDAWCDGSRPEWIYVIMDILINPPSNFYLSDDDSFPWLFFAVAKQCPAETVRIFSLLFKDEKTRPRVEELLHLLGESVDS